MVDLSKIKKELKELPEGWVVLLETNPEDSIEISSFSINELTNKGYSGIIVSASRPYVNLIRLYSKFGIDIKKLLFLDCVSKSQCEGVEDDEHVFYLENIRDLTNISISVNNAIQKIEGKKFLFVDSVTSMLIHNQPEVFVRFIHALLTKLRLKGLCGMLLFLKSDVNPEIRAEIIQLCDSLISI